MPYNIQQDFIDPANQVIQEHNQKQMTNEQILEVASKYLELHPIHGDVSVWDEWCGKEEQLLKFARAIYENGYADGVY